MLRRIMLFLLLLAALIAAGCRPGSGNIAATPTGAATSAPQAAETIAPTNTSEPTATPVPPTSTPAPPTSTPLPPTNTPVPTPAGACYNPWYPITEGTVLSYTASGPERTIGHQTTFSQVTENSFVSTTSVDGVLTGEVHWACSAQGLMSSTFADLDISNMPADIEFKAVSYEGVVFPPAGEWQAGHTWSTTWAMEMQAAIGGVNVTSQIDVEQQNEMIGLEEVTVPAGTFEAMRVETQMSMIMTVAGQTTTTTWPMTSWYARDVGLVKSVSTLNSHPTTTELVAIE